MTGAEARMRARLRDWLSEDDGGLPQVQLATVDESGRPDVRTVLLSTWDDEGFAFHTDAGSRKAAQLRRDPEVALLLLRPGFTRQLVIRGTAVPQASEDAALAYARRSPYLRQLAWQNTAEVAQQPAAARRAAWREFAAEHPANALTPPPSWAGFMVQPDSITFWESDASGPSHRAEYRRAINGWTEHHLPG